MRQLFLDRAALAIKEVCQPVLDDYSVLISVSYSFMSSGSGLAKIISSRDHSLFNKIPIKVKKIAELISGKNLNHAELISKDRLAAGRIFNFGHSCSGVVIAVGAKVRNFRAGDFVACAGTDFATHADIVCVPQHAIVKINQEEHVKAASLAGIGAIALHSVERASLQLGQIVAVFGLELMGQLTIKLCQMTGCKVIGIDSDTNLLQKAQAAGIKNVYDISQDNIVQIIDVLTGYVGIDCAIITPDFGLSQQLSDIISIVKKNGKIVLNNNNPIDLPVEMACRKEIDLVFAGSYHQESSTLDLKMQSYEQKAMTIFVDLLASGRFDLTSFTQNQYALGDLSSALDQLQQKNMLGAVIDYQNYEKLKTGLKLWQNHPLNVSFVPARREQDKFKLGIMGASRHTKLNIMPIISNSEQVLINTIVDIDASRSLNFSNSYKCANVLTGSLTSFQNDDSDLIFISKDVDIDLDTVLVLLQQKKAIFVERAFIDTLEKFEKLENFLHANPQALLCVGYMYRYASFMQKIKAQLDKRSAPFMLQYRMNLGAISKEQRFVGAWRFGGVMAQAAYILDLFYFLAGSKPMSVSVESIRTAGDNSFSTDNFTANVSFADGSLCSLLFTTLGHSDAGSEQLELFFDAKSIIMTDYKNLTGYGFAPYFDEKDREPDLGVQNMLLDFLQHARNNKNILTTEELLVSTKLALSVDRMVY
jgi:threonine dehydrogenase-like Zn-dependent dehydrogenase/predicted dehydrogenase